jgi:hypothetical protein
MQQRTILILTLVFSIIFSLGIGIFIGARLIKPKSSGVTENTYQAGWDAAKARLEKSDMGPAFGSNREVMGVSGVIQQINGNKITVKINPVEAISDPSLDERVIVINQNTKINLNVQRDREQFQKEMQDFTDKVQQPSSDPTQPREIPTPPKSSDVKMINLSELKNGQQISVIASENIKDKKEFSVISIDAQEYNPTTAPTNPSESALNK